MGNIGGMQALESYISESSLKCGHVEYMEYGWLLENLW